MDKAMFSKSIRSELILRTLESMLKKKRILRIEVSRASSHKSGKPADPIAVFNTDNEGKHEAPKPIYTQGYPSMRTVNPYERDPCQYYQSEQTGQSFQHKSGFPQNTTAFPHSAEAFPHYTAGFPQNETEYPQYAARFPSGNCEYLAPCCFGVGGGGKDSKASSCSGRQPPIPPSLQYPCCPPQPCCQPCCQPQPCCQCPYCCSRCGPCSPNGNWCIPQMDCCGQRIVPPPECRPGPVPPNPCRPVYHKKGVFKLYRSIFFFICIPVIVLQFINAMTHEPCPKLPCREYEYMRIRTKRFPWGEGVESFFHNEEVNHLPGDCGPPDLICEP